MVTMVTETGTTEETIKDNNGRKEKEKESTKKVRGKEETTKAKAKDTTKEKAKERLKEKARGLKARAKEKERKD